MEELSVFQRCGWSASRLFHHYLIFIPIVWWCWRRGNWCQPHCSPLATCCLNKVEFLRQNWAWWIGVLHYERSGWMAPMLGMVKTSIIIQNKVSLFISSSVVYKTCYMTMVTLILTLDFSVYRSPNKNLFIAYTKFCNSWHQAQMWWPVHVQSTCQVRHRARCDCPGINVINRA